MATPTVRPAHRHRIAPPTTARRASAVPRATRAVSTWQTEENDELVRELNDNLLKAKMQHEAEMGRIQQQQQRLVLQVRAPPPHRSHDAPRAASSATPRAAAHEPSTWQVRAYHEDLFGAMRSVSASTASVGATGRAAPSIHMG